ncbi:phosphoglycerate dehydrogenase [Gloeobacter violaceus]|uniref:Phosphoglycerate dehydrogenase n=1 Tax=Gloeobacter violaceus (strain ATCC 29082 / PCC 7421) TaxID=251221 RepID=Q7NEV2_GLOVI|nr:phosphoglycerate dehydrogenase [Gloeobacter violaceus]BAC91717.1 phosphoglycerate dehydrogenase [Gloeobacter violaceus PCC 7421]
MRVLVTCPPMLRRIEHFKDHFEARGAEVYCPPVVQTLSVAELVDLLPGFDGWIIGDDPATRAVFAAGVRGRLKAAVKWGVGVDNVDFAAARALGIPIANTPAMFGAEVADVAVSYVTALARETFSVDREVRAGGWPKPCGVSLAGKTVALVGFGDIGKATARRLVAAEMRVIAYDPRYVPEAGSEAVEPALWPERLGEADFIVFTCALTPENRHMLGVAAFGLTKPGVRVVNVARGPLIDEQALIVALASGRVHSAALDVFEVEPLAADSPLRAHERCIFGSHNASNTADAVERASFKAMALLFGFLGID